jgi:osmotically-inducible protein OsmY
MNTLTISTTRTLAVAIALAFSAGAAAQAMSKTDHKTARDGIAADYKSAIAACASQSGNAKDICKAEAKGKRNVARAELEARVSPSDKNQRAVTVAKAKADYAVAREKCDDKRGDEKKLCISAAKSAEPRTMGDAGNSTGAKAPVAATSKKETAQEYVDDSVVTARVKTAVFEEPSLKSAEINVETSKGRVQLSGFVRSSTDINKAVEVTRKVRGVASVQNSMIVKGQQ